MVFRKDCVINFLPRRGKEPSHRALISSAGMPYAHFPPPSLQFIIIRHFYEAAQKEKVFRVPSSIILRRVITINHLNQTNFSSLRRAKCFHRNWMNQRESQTGSCRQRFLHEDFTVRCWLARLPDNWIWKPRGRFLFLHNIQIIFPIKSLARFSATFLATKSNERSRRFPFIYEFYLEA